MYENVQKVSYLKIVSVKTGRIRYRIAVYSQRGSQMRRSIELAGSEVEKPRADGNWWCQCSECLPMQAKIECLCCHDWQFTIPLIQGLNVSGNETVTALCITDSQIHINSIVLEPSLCLPDVSCKKL